MQHLAALLAQRQREGRPVTYALIGAGRFGTTIAAQTGQMPGLRLAVVCDLNLEAARAAWAAAGVPGASVVHARTPDAVADAVRSGRPVVTEDLEAAAGAPVEVVVEATGRPAAAARAALTAIAHGHHVVMVTVEADVLIGPLLRRQADRAGVVYTLADGDQPAVTKRLVDWAATLGYTIVAAGRGTRFFPEDAEGVPEEAFARYGYDPDLVARRRLNPKMYNSFRDGSKAQIEMCALANATGLVPDKRGMHEPSATIADLPRLFRLRSQGGLLSREGVVDLANAIAPDGRTELPNNIAIGVWVVVRTDNPLLHEDLGFYGLPAAVEGQTAALYRPYHLCGVETPYSILEAALLHQATCAPLPQPVAEVITVAKRDLEPGTILDGSGGRYVRGLIERAEIARAENLLPLGLADGVRLNVAVGKGQPIRWDMVAIDESDFLVRLRRQQEATWAEAAR